MKHLALVVENDTGTRRLLQVLLTRAGFDCDGVASGVDGALLAQNVEYDAYFFDLLLPGIGGERLLALLDDAKLRRASVLSAAPEAQLERLRAEWPDVRVMRKPFDLEDVFEVAVRAAETRPPRVSTVREEFCRRSVLAGAKAGLIVQHAGGVVSPVVSYGYPDGFVDTFFPMPIEDRYPLCDAVRNGKPVWIASMNDVETAYPPAAPWFTRNATRAAAAVPVLRKRSVVGAAGWTFRDARRFAEPEQRALTAIAESWAERIGGPTASIGGP